MAIVDVCGEACKPEPLFQLFGKGREMIVVEEVNDGLD